MARQGWIAAIGGFLFAALAQAAPFAMITDIKGEAWASASPQGKQHRLALLSYIESPVEVALEPSTTLGVTYFASGVQYSFNGPARIAFDAEAPRVIEGKPAQLAKVGPEKGISGGLSNDQWRRLQQATVVMRTVKSSFTVISPDKTSVLTLEPEFEWTVAADAKRYRLVVYGSDGQILHEVTTEQTALRPGSTLNLQPGQKYRWKVDALGVARPTSTTGNFAVADDATREKIVTSRPGTGAPLAARILFATSLEAEGYMSDARAEWKALAHEHPGIPEIKQRGM